MTAKQIIGPGDEVAFDALLSTAHQLADLSGQVILPFFRQSLDVDNKATDGDFDPVTQADRAAEETMRLALNGIWPEHGIVGEEFGTDRPTASYRWIIDPIDGTRSFISGNPLWGTLIGLTVCSKPLLGLMDQPFTRERFWTEQDKSFMRVGDNEPIQLATRSCSDLKQAHLATTHPDLFAVDGEQKRFFDLKSNVKLSRYGGDCYSYAMLAAGFVDLVVEAGLKPYDIVALIPIVERAGGIVTTWSGEPATNGGRIIAAGDKRLHEQALRILQG